MPHVCGGVGLQVTMTTGRARQWRIAATTQSRQVSCRWQQRVWKKLKSASDQFQVGLTVDMAVSYEGVPTSVKLGCDNNIVIGLQPALLHHGQLPVCVATCRRAVWTREERCRR